MVCLYLLTTTEGILPFSPFMAALIIALASSASAVSSVVILLAKSSGILALIRSLSKFDVVPYLPAEASRGSPCTGYFAS